MDIRVPQTLTEIQEHHAAVLALIDVAYQYRYALEDARDKMERATVPESESVPAMMEFITKRKADISLSAGRPCEQGRASDERARLGKS